MSGTLPVSEIFGPTIQGEGPFSGRVASFVRLGGCNLSCSWCDSAFTWDASRFNLREEISQMLPSEVVARLPAQPRIVVITGGEPLLYASRPAFRELLAGLRFGLDADVHVESNGTVVPPPEVVDLVSVFVLSPKLPNAGQHRREPDLAADWSAIATDREVYLKFVCVTVDDVQLAARLAIERGFDLGRVWVMPEGIDAATLNRRSRELADAAIEVQVNFSTRLQVLAWGDERKK